MRKKLFHYAFATAFTFICSALAGQHLYYPDTTWQTKKPADLKMNVLLVDSAVQFALHHETKTEVDLRIANLKAYVREPDYKILGPMKERGRPAGLIIYKGYIVAQWGDVERVDMTFSVTKSYLSTVAGLAWDARIIKSPDDRVSDYVEDKFQGDHNAKITWRHLLTQSSDWSGCLFDLCDWADRPPKEGNIDDWKNRKLLEPGSSFEYNDVRVNLLSYSLLQVWRKPLPAVLKEKIMDPIGASSTWRWHGYENSFVTLDGLNMQSVSGGGHHGGGLFINTLDQARFGLLIDRNGKWKDKQLVSSQWISMAQQPSAANRSYGFMWWTNANEDLKGVSKNLFYANGFGGNFIVIDQEHDLVMVSRWLEPAHLGEWVKIVEASIGK